MNFEIAMFPEDEEEWGATPEQIEELRLEFIRITKEWIQRCRAANTVTH